MPSIGIRVGPLNVGIGSIQGGCATITNMFQPPGGLGQCLDKSGVHDRDLSEEEGVVSQGWGSGHRRGAFRKDHTKSMQVHDLVRGILNRRGVR